MNDNPFQANENPYQSPLADLQPAVGVLSGQHADVRAVAVYQKGILVCILVYLGLVAANVVLMSGIIQSGPLPLFSVLILAAFAATGLAGVVFVFLLATKVHGVVVGVLLGLLTFLPCIGLLVLLIVNGRATSILRKNGHRVGLLGANLSEFHD